MGNFPGSFPAFAGTSSPAWFGNEREEDLPASTASP